MSLVKEYIQNRTKRNSYFRDLDPKERINHSEDLIFLKHRIDEMEGQIIKNILTSTLSYKAVYAQLKNKGFHRFLKKSEKIQSYLSDRLISDSIGFKQDERSWILSQFEKLCHTAWEDYIITEDERESLNHFCHKHNIDRTQQTIIESKIAAKYSSDINLIEAVEYYFLEENKDVDEIQSILKKEYRINVKKERLESLTNSLQAEIISNPANDQYTSDHLIKTISFGEVRVYVVNVKNKLSSGYEFEIGFIEGDMLNFKVLVNESTFSQMSTVSQIEVITDAICYKISAQNPTAPLKQFLEQKPLVRSNVEIHF